METGLQQGFGELPQDEGLSGEESRTGQAPSPGRPVFICPGWGHGGAQTGGPVDLLSTEAEADLICKTEQSLGRGEAGVKWLSVEGIPGKGTYVRSITEQQS